MINEINISYIGLIIVLDRGYASSVAVNINLIAPDDMDYILIDVAGY